MQKTANEMRISDWSSDVCSSDLGGVRFGMPLNERDSVNAGLTFDYTKIDLQTQSPDRYREFCDFANDCGNTSLMLSLGWVHDTRDNVLFPNRGVLQRISSEFALPGLDLQYYKLNYQHSWYKDVTKNITFMLNG